ncbi:MAG: hypothetical protein AAFY88_30015 [Acidobacteriota bacterium]
MFSIKKLAVFASLFVACWCSAGNADAVGAPAAVNLDSASDITVRDGGEVHLTFKEIFMSGEIPYQVSLAFERRADLQRFYDLGLETFDLGQLDLLIVVNEDGELVSESGADLTLFEAAEGRRHTICGNVVARGLREMADGLKVAASLHALTGPSGVGSGGGDGTLAGPPDVWYDVSHVCGVFATGGTCPGGVCTNITGKSFPIRFTFGTCQVYSTVFFDVCRCSYT